MAQIEMSNARTPHIKNTYQTADFYFGYAYDNADKCGLSIRKVHQADLQEPYLGICFQINRLSFEKDDIRYNLLVGINEATPLTATPMNEDIVAHEGQYSIAFNDSLFTAMPIGIKPDDFDALKDICYYTKDAQGYKPGYVNEQWQPLVQYYKCSKDFTMRYNVAGSGTIDFSFGIRTIVGASEFGFSQIWSGPNASTFRLTDYDQYSTPYYINQIGNTNKVNYFAVSAGVDSTYTGPYVETFPVSFSIPKDFVLNGYTIPYTASYYGTISITYNNTGIPQQAWVQALEKKCWVTEQGSYGTMGDDTPAYGGKGKQPIARDNPKGAIRKAKSAGILSDPTTGSGVVIYKFTESEFTNFLSKLNNWSGNIGTIGGTPTSEGIVDGLLSRFTNLDNILFIKKSPISFPSTRISLQTLAIGSLGIKNVSCAVVTAWYKEGSFGIPSSSEFIPNTFRDLEPYAAGEIYFPLAGSIAVPPTYLADSNIAVDYGFDLLGEGANYSITLKDAKSGYTTFSISGQCCKDANIFIPGRNVKEAFQSIMPLVGAGVMTLATGGTAAPALTTTAVGAATGFVENVTDLSVTKLPHSGSSQPYDDCVTGGRTNVFLYLVKNEPFNSGELDVDAGKANIEGYLSRYYVAQLGYVSEGSGTTFASVSDVDLRMTFGMTKAEYDKIIAYLKEGVWL